jgi:hypothetical protein
MHVLKPFYGSQHAPFVLSILHKQNREYKLGNVHVKVLCVLARRFEENSSKGQNMAGSNFETRGRDASIFLVPPLMQENITL